MDTERSGGGNTERTIRTDTQKEKLQTQDSEKQLNTEKLKSENDDQKFLEGEVARLSSKEAQLKKDLESTQREKEEVQLQLTQRSPGGGSSGSSRGRQGGAAGDGDGSDDDGYDDDDGGDDGDYDDSPRSKEPLPVFPEMVEARVQLENKIKGLIKVADELEEQISKYKGK